MRPHDMPWPCLAAGRITLPVRMASTAGVDLYPHGLKPVTGGEAVSSTTSDAARLREETLEYWYQVVSGWRCCILHAGKSMESTLDR
jgi:hypothetical protein